MIAAVRDITDRLESQRRLTAAHEQLALVGERERIGRDLHDVVLQHLYGMGLSAQAIATSADPATAGKLEAVVDEVDRIISEVRTIVFTLGPGGRRGALGQELTDVVAQASRVLGFTPACASRVRSRRCCPTRSAPRWWRRCARRSATSPATPTPRRPRS